MTAILRVLSLLYFAFSLVLAINIWHLIKKGVFRKWLTTITFAMLINSLLTMPYVFFILSSDEPIWSKATIYAPILMGTVLGASFIKLAVSFISKKNDGNVNFD